jgi:hypothetical protein
MGSQARLFPDSAILVTVSMIFTMVSPRLFASLSSSFACPTLSQPQSPAADAHDCIIH